jgi:hypothetical protein
MICDFRSQQIDSSTHRTLPITDLGKCVTPGWGVAVGAAILALAEAGSCAANCPFLRLPASPASPHSGRARHWSPVTTFGRTSLVRPWPRTSDLGLHISFPLSCYWSPVTTFGRTSLVRSWTSDFGPGTPYLVPALLLLVTRHYLWAHKSGSALDLGPHTLSRPRSFSLFIRLNPTTDGLSVCGQFLSPFVLINIPGVTFISLWAPARPAPSTD